MDRDSQERDLRDRNCHDKICKVYYSCVPGPQGPAGPAFNTYLMAHHSATVSIPTGGIIPFDSIDQASNLAVNPAGVITIPNAGIYLINFWINATNTGETAAVLSVSLNSITPGAELLAIGTTGESVETGASEVISGYAIIEVIDNQILEIVSDQAMSITAVNGYADTITITRIS